MRVLIIKGDSAGKVAMLVYEHPSLAALLISCKACSGLGDVKSTLADIIYTIVGFDYPEDKPTVLTVISKIHGYLEGKRFLVLVTTDQLWEWECNELLDALLDADVGCLPGSSIIMATKHHGLGLSSPPNVYDFYDNQATKLGAECSYHVIFAPCHTEDTFAMRTFLHLLYVNPNRTQDELQHYTNAIFECRRLKRSVPKQVLLWC